MAEACDRRKGSQAGTPPPGADAPTGQTRSGCLMRGTGENMDGGVGFYFTGGQRGARD